MRVLNEKFKTFIFHRCILSASYAPSLFNKKAGWEDLTASEVLEYEDEILALIQKERLPNEGDRGLAVYLDGDLSRKVYSINPLAEEWNGELWGVTEVQADWELSPSELVELTDWLSGQFSDGWGEGKGKLVKDVFTPHYQNYYSSFGKTPPTDDQEPIPIEFLCIENFRFKIYIGTRKVLNDNEKINFKMP